MKLVILNIFATLLLFIACSSDNSDTKRTPDTSNYSSTDSLLRHMDSVSRHEDSIYDAKADRVYGQFAFGRSLEDRRQYYTEMIHLVRKARNYADSAIPERSFENQDLFLSKKEEFVSSLRTKYGFTKVQADSISYEALWRKWPLPEVVP